jgi:hypothetical protein
MAQVKLLKIGSDGLPTEFDSASDEITLNSFTIQGGGPVLSSTGLDMNNQDITEIKDLTFNDPSTATVTQTGGSFLVDDIMFQTKENVMTTAGAVLFPVVTDSADELDAFRLPAIAGTPTATPADGGEGYLAWDSTNDKMYAWNGSAWDDLSSVSEANKIVNSYTADGVIAIRDVVYISGADTVAKAQGDAVATARVVGFATAGAADTNPVNVQSEGFLGGFTSLTSGLPQYLSAATAGLITETLPVGAGNVIVRMGYAKNTTTVDIHIEQLGRRAS